MEITGEYRLKGTRQEIWDVLNDPDQLAKAIPGSATLTEVGPDRYRAEMRVGFGLVRGKVTGNIAVTDKVTLESYRMVVDGSGGVGWVRGESAISLSDDGESRTLVNVAGETEAGGLLSRVGERVMRNVANSLMKQFFENVEKLAAEKR